MMNLSLPENWPANTNFMSNAYLIGSKIKITPNALSAELKFRDSALITQKTGLEYCPEYFILSAISPLMESLLTLSHFLMMS
jgi:hypothetical protein